jgi:serine protease Do
MLHIVKRSLISAGTAGLVALIGFAPPAHAEAPSTWLPPLPLGAGLATGGAAVPQAVGATSAQGPGAASAQGPGAVAAAGVPAPQGVERATDGSPYEDGSGTSSAAAPSDPSNEAAGQVSDPSLTPTPQQLYQHVLRGVVALERNGVPMAIGTVLSGDGRVLTALSGLAGGDGADVRYADGTLVHAKVGRSDRGSDLALLVPASLKWTEGLTASDTDPAGQELRAILPAAHGTHLGPAAAAVKGQVDAHARDGIALLRMLDVDVKGMPVAGAPLLDSTGGVVGVLVRACKGAPTASSGSDEAPGTWYPTSAPSAPAAAARAACKSVVLGAPVTAIRSFLTHASPAPAAAPWLGIRGEPQHTANVTGVRVVAVAPSSPAEKAALKPATDLIVAVDGHPIDTPEKLADLIAKHAPGETVKLLVFAGDQFREVAVALKAAP